MLENTSNSTLSEALRKSATFISWVIAIPGLIGFVACIFGFVKTVEESVGTAFLWMILGIIIAFFYVALSAALSNIFLGIAKILDDVEAIRNSNTNFEEPTTINFQKDSKESIATTFELDNFEFCKKCGADISNDNEVCHVCSEPIMKEEKKIHVKTSEERWVEEIKNLSTEELKLRSEDDYNWTEKYRELCYRELQNR